MVVMLVCGVSTVSFAKSSSPGLNLNLNGSVVSDFQPYLSNDHIFVSVEKFSDFYHLKFSWDPQTKTLKLGKDVVDTDNGKAIMVKNVLTASIKSMAKAIGGKHFEMGWDNPSRTLNLTILPEGTVMLTPAVPQMGEHWANPNHMPMGPIYGLYKGKLVFIEIMPAKDLDKTVHDIPGNKVPIPNNIDHFDIDWNPEGHEGYAVPHYDVHLYFINRDEQNKIMPDEPMAKMDM
jgi:hypothetical protein